MKYEYDYVRIEVEGKSLWTTELVPKASHHELIDQRAEEGWRLVQIFAPAIGPAGHAISFELIFERPVAS